MKKILSMKSLIIVVLSFILLVSIFNAYQINSKFNDVNSELTYVKKQIKTINFNVDDVNSKADNLDSAIYDLQNHIDVSLFNTDQEITHNYPFVR